MTLLLLGCNYPLEHANQKFGKQHFVSAVSMIELHKTRTGLYPSTLNELQFLGDWDGIWLSSVKYEKTESGYNLYLTKGWVSEPKLEFPAGFRHGLGIKDTNIKWI